MRVLADPLVRVLGILLLAFILFASMFAGFGNLDLLAAWREPDAAVRPVVTVLGHYAAIAVGLWLAAHCSDMAGAKS